MPNSRRKVKSICLTQEEYAQLAEAKDAYSRDMGQKADFGTVIAFLAVAYFIGKGMQQQGGQQPRRRRP